MVLKKVIKMTLKFFNLIHMMLLTAIATPRPVLYPVNTLNVVNRQLYMKLTFFGYSHATVIIIRMQTSAADEHDFEITGKANCYVL